MSSGSLDLGSLGNMRTSRTPSAIAGRLFLFWFETGSQMPCIKDDFELLNLVSCLYFPSAWAADSMSHLATAGPAGRAPRSEERLGESIQVEKWVWGSQEAWF